MALPSIAEIFLTILIWVRCVELSDTDQPEHIDPSGFSTKTAYQYCSLSSFEDGSLKRLGSCTRVHINAIYRDGTRYPSLKDVRKSTELHSRLISSQGAELPAGFREYPFPFANGTDRGLLPRGLEELFELGQWIRMSNPTWFEHLPNITFTSGEQSRAIVSARSFYHGVLGLPPLHAPQPRDVEQYLVGVPEDIQIEDRLLRFYAYCAKYYHSIKKNETANQEYWKFMEGAEMKQVYQEIISKHFLPEADFSTDDIFNIFKACAFDVASFSDFQSPWCGFLTAHHQRVFEYLMDLKEYWMKFNGYELNKIAACPLIGKIFNEIRDAALKYKQTNYNIRSNPQLHRASFWFGHDSTIMPIIAALGLFNDSVGHEQLQQPYADGFNNWLEKLHARPQIPTMFRGGHIAPAAGNLVLELYHCPAAVSSQDNDLLAGFFILPRVNNRTVAWPLASPTQPPTAESPGSTIAPLSDVLKLIEDCMPGVYHEEKHCTCG